MNELVSIEIRSHIAVLLMLRASKHNAIEKRAPVWTGS
jgi:hypothetical protein